MNNEQFTCEGCGGIGHINGLRRRISMPGAFCAVCAANEKCAACSEIYPVAFTEFKDDVKNIICDNCKHDYKDVAQYIKPIYSLNLKAA